MDLADIKIKAIDALKDEMRQIGAAHLVDSSKLTEDKISIFKKNFNIKVLESIKSSDNTYIADTVAHDNTDPYLLLLPGNIQDDILKILRENNINFCDTEANLQIIIGDFRLNNVKTPTRTEPLISQNLKTASALKVIFCLLRYEESIMWPMRRLAEASDVSLGTVQRVVEVLKKMQ